MRLVIDLQGVQSDSCIHGESCYSLSLAQAIARNAGDHQILIVLNGAFAGSIIDIRNAFRGILPRENIHIFDIATPTSVDNEHHKSRRSVAEMIRECYIAQLKPDVILTTGLFAGFSDNAITAIGNFAGSVIQAVLLFDYQFALELEKLNVLPHIQQHLYHQRDQLKSADLVLAATSAKAPEVAATLGIKESQLFLLPGSTMSPPPPPASSNEATISTPLPTWDELGQRIIHRLTQCLIMPRNAQTHLNSSSPKRRLAFISPLPPERTGIADYSAQILTSLKNYFDIELIVNQNSFTLPQPINELPRRTIKWFQENAHTYDQIIYQIGNSHFHAWMIPLLCRYPGVVVLHDFFLGDLYAYLESSGTIPEGWLQELHHAHGHVAVKFRKTHGDHKAVQEYPCSLTVLENATRVIVHSEYSRNLADYWYGKSIAQKVDVIPLVRIPPTEFHRSSARAALGFSPDDFIVCSFGYLTKYKHSLRIIEAWLASQLSHNQHARLVFIGENSPGEYGAQITHTINSSPHKSKIKITGWADEDTYKNYLQAADLCVQLRCNSRGEVSAAVLDCLSYGIPTIVNLNGSMAELPDDVVTKLPDHFNDTQLISALEELSRNSDRRQSMSELARQLLRERYSPDPCAQQYEKSLVIGHTDELKSRKHLLKSLHQKFDHNEAELDQFVSCISSIPDPPPQRQLLVDVTAIARTDLKSGIERVVRNQLRELFKQQTPKLRVEPVYLRYEHNCWVYHYARRYTQTLLGLPASSLTYDPIVDVNPGDIFYGADFIADLVTRASRQGVYAQWQKRGVYINFAVYDLLPLSHPDCFPVGANQHHANWVQSIARDADQLICISEAVEQETRTWLSQNIENQHLPNIVALHLGSDITTNELTTPVRSKIKSVLQDAPTDPIFLMVSTIEPRKGHLQAIEAFSRLWDEGMKIRLIIVGKEGWTALPDEQRRTIPTIINQLRNHPESGKKLFWLNDVNDTELELIYKSCTCLLVPSVGEGFGLPLIEAAQHNIPLLIRDIPVFREVAGEHAHYFSGTTASDLSSAISSWLKLHAQGEVPTSQGIPRKTWAENVCDLYSILTNYKS